MPEQNLDLTPIVTETAFTSSFGDIVLDRQKRWKSLRQKPLKEFSQAVDIPDTVSKNLLGLVVDNLPSYVPEKLKIKLRKTHPNPIIAVGVLADKRIFHDRVGMAPDFITPENIAGEETQLAYQRGLLLLNEIATDTLAQDVLRQLGLKHRWFKPVAAVLESRNPARSAYKSGLKKAEQVFGGKEKFETFRQSLILAMLTGYNDSVNEQLKGLGYENLDQFAGEMGKSAGYSDVVMDFLGRIINPRAMYSFGSGVVAHVFPGVINIPLAHTLPSLLNMGGAIINVEQLATKIDNPVIAGTNLLLLAFNSYFVLRPELAISNAVIHETCHYLSLDTTHSGLWPVKYNEESKVDVSAR